MQLDFNAILDATVLTGPATTLVMDNVAYTIRPLTLVDGAAIDAARVPQAGEATAAHNARIIATLIGLFDGPPLPFLAAPAPTDSAGIATYRREVLALIATVGAIVRDNLDPKAIVAAAMAAATEQIDAAEDTGTDSTAGAA